MLDQGPVAHGYGGDRRWTLARVSELINGMFGVRHKELSSMARLLRWAGYSWQVPTRQAAERDEEKIAAWREETWPNS
jgi:transposase